jgi:ketosteroid isomerase-like protein/effector-binding domain-containing protein
MTDRVRLVALALGVMQLWQVPSAWAQMGDLRARLEAVDERMRSVLRDRDAAAWGDFYTEDAELNSPGQPTVRGREAIVRQFEWVTRLGISGFRNRIDEVLEGADMATTLGTVEFLGPAEQVVGRFRYMTLWKRDATSWRIHRDFALPLGGGLVGLPAELDVRVEALPPMHAVVLPMKGSYEAHDEAIFRIAEYVGSRGMDPVGPLFGRYFNDPRAVPTEELRWEVGMPLARPATAAAPFEARTFDGLTAHLVVPGPHDGNQPWDAFSRWIEQHGYVQTGPSMEIWLDGPAVEMRAPVEKR